ncbi:unnamed protein product [Clavelina lepadiformis]|uniref:DRBM domain-containing protein n=1 Tax=Clavelina lepadiformis TaxID=159417 RepID=A0ABP0GYJ2_CLALP
MFVSPASLKSPTWIINELTRHHKLKAEYKLEKEEGKLPSKIYTFSLTIDGDSWLATGDTAKQARQNVAQKAIDNTTLTFPPPKKKSSTNPRAMTPTVELNGLAMIRGLQVTYTLLWKMRNPNALPYNMQQQQLLGSKDDAKNVLHEQQNSENHSVNLVCDFSDGFCRKSKHHRYRQYYDMQYSVCVNVADKIFYGQGRNEQTARHDAAKNALNYLKSDAKDASNKVTTEDTPDNHDSQQQNTAEKSPICLLYEEALPRSLSVVFNTVEEAGPPHLRKFTVEVTVGHFENEQLDINKPNFKAQSPGLSKKSAKQGAASAVLEQMRDLPPIIKKTTSANRSKKQTILDNTVPNNVALHPVSRLMQMTHAMKISPPVYSVEEKKTGKHVTNFIVVCKLEEKTSFSQGISKKEAKRNAAEEMLQLMGYKVPVQSRPKSVPNLNAIPAKTSLKKTSKNQTNSDTGVSRHQVKFLDIV